MPAFPKLTELPTEAKSKELKAQLEADFKIAKKNGDLKKQQQQWIDISDGGEPAGKIYAINRLLKGISDPHRSCHADPDTLPPRKRVG